LNNNINTIIVNNYQSNIEYFKTEHIELYTTLLQYENSLDNDTREERYELCYESGGFDIFDTKTQSYIYLQQSDKITQIIQESITFKKNENVFETFKRVENPPKGYKTLLKLYQKYNNKKFSMKKIDKFVFFGTGLHIESVDKKLNARHYLIIEDSFELFRLSLFTTPYYQIAEHAKLHFCISDDTNHFKQSAQKFLDEEFYYNHYIKFFQALHHSDEKLKQLHNIIVTQSHLNFFYSSIVEQYTRSLYYLNNGYNFLNLLNTKLHQYFRKKPTLLLAPGPSLDKNIEWLQNNQNNFLIVALSATLPILENAEIKPDIITHFDGFERSALHFTKLKNISFFKDALLLFSTKTPPNVVDMFEKERLFFFESGTNFKKDFGSLSAFCTGSSTYLILIALQVQELYLLGLDLAVDQKTLQTHSDEYLYTQTSTIQEEDMLDFRNSLIEVTGNFQNSVKTTPNFTLSIDAINSISLGLKQKNQNVYNLSDGAYFQATKAQKAEQLKPSTPIAKTDLLKLFSNASEKSLSTEDLRLLQNVMKDITQIKTLLQTYSKQNITDKRQLLQKLIQLENAICLCGDKSCEIRTLIFHNYTRFIYPYIFDLCNTQEINIESEISKFYVTTITALKDIAQELETKLKGKDARHQCHHNKKL